MKKTFMRRAGIACLAFVVVLAVVLMSPVARLAAYSGTLDACVNPGNGMMRLVNSSADCHANEGFVEWDITGPQGPSGPQGPQGAQGPQGPQGPSGASAGGPPFVWVCSPAYIPGAATLGGNSPMYVFVFNGSSSTANVAVHVVDKDGNNLAGIAIPGATTPPLTYPGQTGSTTVPVNSLQSLINTFQLPQDFPAGGPNVSVAVQVISDQSVVVSAGFPPAGWSGPCGLLSK
jgi:hypothetical protein